MGFYGNITNTSNTTFQFDRIYPNRLAMDANANNDGIFIGRYVLVEYDQNAAYPNIYIKTVDGETQYFSSPGYEAKTRIQYKEGGRPAADTSKDVFYLGEFGQKQETEKIYFYMCDGYVSVTEDNKTINYATFKQVTVVNIQDATPYLINHNIDYDEYKNAKGYDSTVWTKVSEESNGKLITRYRNIADLNSVVPTFDLEIDAPTMTPIIPHFDADSTNVYYKLHTQPQWGLRVAEKSDETNSDGVTTWLNTTYDPITDTTITHKNENVIAAINYNGPAFEEQVDKNRKSEAGIKKHDNSNNYITILPTGESGQKYYTHTNKNGEKVYETAPDIQEMRISLPAIGNMMSDAWDIIHGPLRNDAQTDENSSLQGRLDSFKAMEKNSIPIKRNSDGTFVGTRINGNTPRGTVPSDEILAEPLSIDFDKDDAWIRTEINTVDLDNKTKLSGISIHHTWNEGPTTLGAHDKNTPPDEDATQEEIILWTAQGGSENIKLNTPNVDKAGHIVGWHHETVTLPFGYKTFTTNGLVNETDADLDSSTGRKTTADNTQDTLAINTKNKWLQIEVTNDKIELAHEIHNFDTNSAGHTNLNKETGAKQENNLTIYDWAYDNAGHIISKKAHTYTLPYGFKYIEVANDGDTSSATPASMTGTQTADSTQDNLKLTTSNKWILLDAGEEDTIKFGHKLSPLSKGEHASTDTTLGAFGESFKILKYETDEAGHVISSGEDTITLPIGSYNPANSATAHTDIITSIGFTPSTGEITSTKATTDTLTLSNYNANNGKLSILYTDTINKGFEKIQNHINALDMNSISTTEFITEITQTDGQVAVKRAAAGTLQLGTASTDGTIPATSSLNNAFNITNARIKAEEDALTKEIQDRKDAITKEVSDRNTAISSAISAIVDKDDDGTINKLAEVIEWINNNPSTATQMQKAIQDNIKAISDEAALARSHEEQLADAIAEESDRATTKENEIAAALTIEVGRATAAEQANTVAIGNEKTRAESAEQGLQDQINAFGTAANHNHEEYALAGSYDGKLDTSVYEEKIAELQLTIDNLYGLIEGLEQRIIALEPEVDNNGETI